MDKKVQFLGGMLSGMLFPVVAWLIFDVLLKTSILNRPALPYLISVAINLFFLKYLVKNSKAFAAYGLMIATFIVTILIFKFKQ